MYQNGDQHIDDQHNRSGQCKGCQDEGGQLKSCQYKVVNTRKVNRIVK